MKCTLQLPDEESVGVTALISIELALAMSVSVSSFRTTSPSSSTTTGHSNHCFHLTTAALWELPAYTEVAST